MASQLAPLVDEAPHKLVVYKKFSLTDPTTHIASVTNTGGGDYADTLGTSRITIECQNNATNAVTFTVEGSFDGTNFYTLAYKTDSLAAYAITGLVVAGSAKDIVHLSPTEYVRYVRVNQSAANANGTTYNLYCET